MGEIKFKFMKIACSFFLIVSLTSCFHGFMDKKNFIDKMPKIISSDSVVILNPAFTMWLYSANNDFNYPLWQNGRPDSFNKILSKTLNENKLLSTLDKGISTRCMDDKITLVGKWQPEDRYSIEKHKCLKLKKEFYNVFFNVSMGVQEAVADVSGREHSRVSCYVIIIKDSSITYYKYYDSFRTARKSHFPKSSKDRKDYPYFANDQIERVVKNITADLIKRIIPAKK